jgi:hypothetical protein
MLQFESMNDAIRVANEVLAGTTDPYLGCGLISSIGAKLSYPPNLHVFSLLDHDKSGHEHVGLTKEDLLPEILEACRKLVTSNP